MKRQTILTFIIALLVLITSNSAKAEIFLSKFGSSGAGAGEFSGPHGIAIDSSGNIYVADVNNLRVQKFGPNGNFLWQITGFAPQEIAVDRDDNIYVTDPENRLVKKYSSAGNLLLQINPPCSVGIGHCIDPDGPGPRPYVYRPDGVAVDSQNNVLIIGVFHLQKFNSTGSLLTEFQLGGIVPQSIVIDSADNIIFWEKDWGSINKYDASGNFLFRFSEGGCDLATGHDCVDPDGPGPLELGDGQFGGGGPSDVAVDSSGNIYGTDSQNGRVQKFSSTGQYLLKFGSAGSGDGQFGDGGSGATVSPTGKLYVTDSNDRVQIFGQGDTRSVSSATGAGVVILTSSSGMFQSAVAVDEGSLPATGKPANVTFPYGFFAWTITGLNPGQSISMSLTHPAAVAAGAQYWKVINGNWIDATSLLSSDDGDNVLVLTITDGGLGDADGAVNGQISDPGGLAASVEPPADVPFKAFQAIVKIMRGPSDSDDYFELRSTVILGASSDGIDPIGENVVLDLAGMSLTIPRGSFSLIQKGHYKFDGKVDTVSVSARIILVGDMHYEVRIEGTGADLNELTNPVVAKLAIGNDSGKTTGGPVLLTKATPILF